MILYVIDNDKRFVKKVLKKLVDISDFKIKENVNILKPIILLSNSKALGCNYVYIKKFKRYYFVDNITVLSDGLIQLECSVDVLYTYKDNILAMTTFIERQESDYSPYVVDNEVVTQCKREVRYQILGGLPEASGSYIALTVSGGNKTEEREETT